MTHLRKMMLEELERRNYSQSTTRSYLRVVEDLSRHCNRPAEELHPEDLRQYQAYLFRERHLTANSVNQRVAAICRKVVFVAAGLPLILKDLP